MDKECMIIRDLIPGYMEGLTNETTQTVVETHLRECSKCRAYYAEFVEQKREEQEILQGKEKSFGRMLLRYRYQMLGGFLGVVFTILIFVLLLYLGVRFVNKISSASGYTDNVEEYGEFDGYEGLSRLVLFPEKQQLEGDGVTINQYVCDCSGLKMYQNCQIYLECTYDEESYQKEIARLKETQAIYNDTEYPYPAVYTMRNWEGCNEYVLLMDNKIVYIYLQGTTDRSALYFAEDYLPPDYGQNGMNFEEVEEYNFYEFQD